MLRIVTGYNVIVVRVGITAFVLVSVPFSLKMKSLCVVSPKLSSYKQQLLCKSIFNVVINVGLSNVHL